MESRKSFHRLGETIHSLLGWKSHLTTNWVKSVCDIMKSDLKPTDIETMVSTDNAADESCFVISKIEEELIVLTDYVNHLNTQRRHILNDFLDLRGNIRVFCRIRPVGGEEKFGPLRRVTALDSNNVLLKLAENKSKSYSFDKVFHPGSTQDEVFGEVELVIKSALDGYNACIFAYGQTGTGKSYTMEGTPNSPGVVSRAMEAIFKQAFDSNRGFVFSFSMLEIYLGNLKDLLVPQATKPMDPMPPCLSIKTCPKGGIEIDNLVSIRVTDFNQALKLYRLGCRLRSTAATNSNSTSSRSHCLIRLSIICFNAPERRREANKIWFIDLGGSERVLKTKASGRRLDEGKAINLSLSALGDVIHALHNKSLHVPYRNSKLTQVLKDSLGEDSKTLMLVHISPREEDLCETVCSLSFATRVRSIHLGITESIEEKELRESEIANVEQKMKMVEQEREEIRRNINKLNEELERLTGKPSLSIKDDQQSLEQSKKSETTETTNNEASLPRFMKATICSSRRKSLVDYQTFEDKLPARTRIRRASSMRFPVKQSSECSISRNSCFVDLNAKSNADDETQCSHDTAEFDIKNIIFAEHVKKKSFISMDKLKVDNWLQLHKNKPAISSISRKSKRVLAIRNPDKKQPKLEKSKNVAKNKSLKTSTLNLNCFDDKESIFESPSFVEEAILTEDATPSCSFSPPEIVCESSFGSNQNDEHENSAFVKDETQCANSTDIDTVLSGNNIFNEHPNDRVVQQLKPLEKSGRYHLLVRKIQIVCASVLLPLGFQNLGLEDNFFHGLTL